MTENLFVLDPTLALSLSHMQRIKLLKSVVIIKLQLQNIFCLYMKW